MKLTIAIPTYNRNEILKKNLNFLIPQLTTDCRLIIIDNASDNPVDNDLKDIILNHKKINIKVIRNRDNIGLTGNILRCFELCEDPWLWVLGDDDEVKSGALEKIIFDIENNKDVHFINYAWDAPSFLRKGSLLTHGVGDFIDNIENLGVALFISAGIYNTKKIKKYLSFGNFFQTTYAPHLVMLFLSVGDEGQCILSNEQIVTNRGFETPESLRWDQIFIYQITLLLRLPLSPNAVYKLKNKLKQLTRVWTITHLIFVLVKMGCIERSTKRTLILYDSIVKGFFYLDDRLISKIITYLGYFIIKNPFLFNPILNFAYRVKRGKNFEPIRNLRI